MQPVLAIKDLSIRFSSQPDIKAAVDCISFSLARGKITALIGESGSGKSATALNILRLLPESASVTGEIIFQQPNGETVDLTTLSPPQLRDVRGKSIAMVFQEPMSSLNPLMRCGLQLLEVIRLHQPNLSKAEATNIALQSLEKAGLANAAVIARRFPHEISGGQKQRVMIAMAISCEPSLLILDEPTTALDPIVQAEILLMLKKLQRDTGLSMFFITHDLRLAANFADEILVMYRGEIVEEGNASEVLAAPKNPYTRALATCAPSPEKRGRRLPTVKEILAGEEKPMNDEFQFAPVGDAVLTVENLSVIYNSRKKFAPGDRTTAVNNVSFHIRANEILGLAGESGCGKTTLGKALLGLVPVSSGRIILNGREIASRSHADIKQVAGELQMVFQDPYGSLNPRLRVGAAIAEAAAQQPGLNNSGRQEEARRLLREVGLDGESFDRYPHHFSGGQRQRICIARALATGARLLVFDESVSALDLSVQARILNLVNELREKLSFSALFISHDLAVLEYISDRILVMQAGAIVEEGATMDIFRAPQTYYTKRLQAAGTHKNQP